jgi:hypothetical protein
MDVIVIKQIVSKASTSRWNFAVDRVREDLRMVAPWQMTWKQRVVKK